MELKFIKTSPTQNMTLLIETPVPRERQLAVAERLIAYDSIYAEQAGYIEEPQDSRAVKRLQMMAGEFCGNATLSLAALLLQREGIALGEKRNILLEVSGAAKPVSCELTRLRKGFFGSVEMPLPQRIEERRLSLGGEAYLLTAVVFEGITHILLPASLWKEGAEEKAEQAARLWAKELPEAFGLLLFDENSMTLKPLVSVQGVSLIWERGCGSGTSAVGAYLAQREGRSMEITLHQPGGDMQAAALWEKGRISSLKIAGHVSLVGEGMAYLEEE